MPFLGQMSLRLPAGHTFGQLRLGLAADLATITEQIRRGPLHQHAAEDLLRSLADSDNSHSPVQRQRLGQARPVGWENG